MCDTIKIFPCSKIRTECTLFIGNDDVSICERDVMLHNGPIRGSFIREIYNGVNTESIDYNSRFTLSDNVHSSIWCNVCCNTIDYSYKVHNFVWKSVECADNKYKYIADFFLKLFEKKNHSAVWMLKSNWMDYVQGNMLPLTIFALFQANFPLELLNFTISHHNQLCNVFKVIHYIEFLFNGSIKPLI
jgi:hypothetical protein